MHLGAPAPSVRGRLCGRRRRVHKPRAGRLLDPTHDASLVSGCRGASAGNGPGERVAKSKGPGTRRRRNPANSAWPPCPVPGDLDTVGQLRHAVGALCGQKARSNKTPTGGCRSVSLKNPPHVSLAKGRRLSRSTPHVGGWVRSFFRFSSVITAVEGRFHSHAQQRRVRLLDCGWGFPGRHAGSPQQGLVQAGGSGRRTPVSVLRFTRRGCADVLGRRAVLGLSTARHLLMRKPPHTELLTFRGGGPWTRAGSESSFHCQKSAQPALPAFLARGAGPQAEACANRFSLSQRVSTVPINCRSSPRQAVRCASGAAEAESSSRRQANVQLPSDYSRSSHLFRACPNQ